MGFWRRSLRWMLTAPTVVSCLSRVQQIKDRLLFKGIRSQDTVVFFPTASYVDHDTVHLPIHGWIFDEEQDSKSRKAFLKVLNRVVRGKSDPLEEHSSVRNDDSGLLLDRRVRPFLVDNHRRRKISIQILGKVYELTQRSRKNGHFHGTIQIPIQDWPTILQDEARAGRSIAFHAITGMGNETRRFQGHVVVVPETGLSVISDIDDTVKISQVRDKKRLLHNTFLREFEAVPGMADLYQKWHDNHPNVVFHYVSSSPWQLYPEIANFLQSAHFPADCATFHLKSIRLKDRSVLSLLEDPMTSKVAKISSVVSRYPHRSFVLVGDSGERDPEIYATVHRRFPNQVCRIWIRNVTDDCDDGGRYREAFDGIPRSVWTVFNDPHALSLDL